MRVSHMTLEEAFSCFLLHITSFSCLWLTAGLFQFIKSYHVLRVEVAASGRGTKMDTRSFV